MRCPRRVILIVALASRLGMEALAAGLAEYRQRYEEALAALTQEDQTQQRELRHAYGRALDALLQKVTRAGDLDSAVVARSELARFSQDGTLPPAVDERCFAELNALQLTSVRRAEELRVARARHVLSLSARYDEALKNVQADLTRANNLEAAVAVRREREALVQRAEVAAARDLLRRSESTAAPAHAVAEEPQQAPAADSSTTLLVPAGKPCLESDCRVEKGRFYRITAQGRWRGSDGHQSGPFGAVNAERRRLLGPPCRLPAGEREKLYVGQHPRNALIAQIEGQKWTLLVGDECTFLAPASGRLVWRINDSEFSDKRSGELHVDIQELPGFSWECPKGTCEIRARIDGTDRLHVTREGLFWVHIQDARVGEHSGYHPTVINDVYWWPAWTSADRTETLPVTVLFPPLGKKLRIKKVEAERGECVFENITEDAFVLRFSDLGYGSSTVAATLGW